MSLSLPHSKNPPTGSSQPLGKTASTGSSQRHGSNLPTGRSPHPFVGHNGRLNGRIVCAMKTRRVRN